MALIYVVEDDKNIQEIETFALANVGYEVKGFDSAMDFYEALNDTTPDLILLDIMLPDEDGLSIVKKLRTRQDTVLVPVIMVTAKTTEIDKVKGLDLGADDYITKPFSLMILRARVERMLARMAQDKGLTYEKDGYRFVFEQMYFTVEGKEVTLSKTEQKLLRILIEHQGQTLTREQLVDRIWSDGAQYVEENALSVTVGRLRKKLEQTGKKNPIQTVYGLGYVWER